jgi:hypothetical protein
MGLNFEAKFPEDIPRSLPLYALERPEPFPASAARLSKVAQQLGLPGRAAEVCLSDDWTMHHEGSWEMGLHLRSGGLLLRNRDRYGVQHEDRSFEMSDEEAERVAGRFLEGAGLIPMEEGRMLRVTHLQTQGGDRRSREFKEPTLLDAGVLYGRSLRDVVVEGPGGKAMVNVDPEGEIAALRMVWRPAADVVAEVEIRPPDVAHAAMEDIAGKVRGDVVVTGATFGYFEQGMDDTQSYLQPAYAMIYVVRDEEVSFKSAEVLAATEKVFEPLRGEKRFPAAPQPDREG